MKFDPSSTALLVVDMQKDFYANGGKADKRGKPLKQMQALPSKINKFTAELRSLGVKVIFSKSIYNSEKSPSNFTELNAQTRNAVYMCEEGTDGAELSGVDVLDQDTVIEKYALDCFGGTNLNELLTEWNIKNLIITGVRAEICVLVTATRSFTEGFNTFVVSDLVGTYDDKQDIAAGILDALQYFSYVVTSEEILQL